MNLDNVIKDNIVLVIPDCLKSKVLKNINERQEIFKIKIMSLNELKNAFLYQYDRESIYFIMQKYNLKYEVAKVYLENIKYLNNDEDYGIKKISKLLKIKEELLNNKLLKTDKILKDYLLKKEIIIYGYDYLDSYTKNILKDLNYKFIKKEVKNYQHKIYHFKTLEDEIEYVGTKIIELYLGGVSFNKIKLANVTSEYQDKLELIFKNLNIPIEKISKNSIYETSMINYFLKNINEPDVLTIIQDKYDLENLNNKYIYDSLIKILNNYYFADSYTDIIDLLIDDFKNTSNYYEKYDDCIEIINLEDNIFEDDEYVFLLGFNQENIPHIYLDEDYINDDIKPYFSLDNHYEKNKMTKDNLIEIISSIKNLFITYKDKTAFQSYTLSSLNDYLKYEIIEINDFVNCYSNKMNYLKLASMLDNLVKYNEINPEIHKYYHNYQDINYLKYDNKFKGIDEEKIQEYLKDGLTISFTSLDNFYRCQFRYYINNILKLSPFEETLETKIGNVFHEVLANCFNDDFNFNESYKIALEKQEINQKEKHFFKNLKEELKFVIETLYKQNSYSSLNKFTCENSFYVNKDKNIKVTFMGKIDKIISDEDNKYLVIVDYKTGVLHKGLDNVIYGINMQLPIYLYLAKQDKKLKNAQVIGFYLQKILNQKNLSKEEKEKCLKLQGYSTANEMLLEKFDNSYQDSNLIASMKLCKTGLHKNSKTISNEEIDELVNLVDKKIDEARDEILIGNFKINPKKIDGENIGCEFCKYKDLCYMRENDFVYLDKEKDTLLLSEER